MEHGTFSRHNLLLMFSLIFVVLLSDKLDILKWREGIHSSVLTLTNRSPFLLYPDIWLGSYISQGFSTLRGKIGGISLVCCY